MASTSKKETSDTMTGEISTTVEALKALEEQKKRETEARACGATRSAVSVSAARFRAPPVRGKGTTPT